MREDDFRNFQLRICSSLFDRIEDWRRSQPEIPSRAEAARQYEGS